MNYIDKILQQKYEFIQNRGKNPETLSIGEEAGKDLVKELNEIGYDYNEIPVKIFELKVVLTKNNQVKVH